MRRLALLLLLPLVLALLPLAFVGCDGRPSSPNPSQPTATQVPVVTYLPPESSRTPDGAQPEAPPVSLPPVTLPAMHISVAGLRLIESFEGYSRCAYWDPYGRVYTIGFGQTEGVYAGECLSGRAQAEGNLRYLVESRYEWAIRATGVRFDQHEWDSLCSTLWNLGAGIVGAGTQLGGLLRAHDWQGYADALRQYDHAGGVVLPGLRARRLVEVRLFLSPERRPPAPKPGRAALLRLRSVLRADLTRHRCRVAPYHGRGKYHAVCRRWLLEGAQVNRALRA